jgi:hypothetical protein
VPKIKKDDKKGKTKKAGGGGKKIDAKLFDMQLKGDYL